MVACPFIEFIENDNCRIVIFVWGEVPLRTDIEAVWRSTVPFPLIATHGDPLTNVVAFDLGFTLATVAATERNVRAYRD
jgi:hypothetical protein